MDTTLWSDDEFRSFIAGLRTGIFSSAYSELDRDGFIVQAHVRIAPEVRRRLLGGVGAATHAHGIAAASLEILEDEVWSERAMWLMVTTDPWGTLTDRVTDSIRASYRATVPKNSDKTTLDGIAEASSRAELEAGSGTEDADTEDADAARS